MKSSIKIALFLLSVTLILGCTRTSPRIDAYNFLVKNYYMKVVVHTDPPADESCYEKYSYDAFLSLYAPENIFFEKTVIFHAYGTYTEFGDTIVTYPRFIVDMINDTTIIVNDTSCCNGRTRPSLYIKQKDGSLLLYVRKKRDEYSTVKSIKYNGIDYYLDSIPVANWDYRLYPKEVRDSIAKIMEYDIFDTLYHYIPLKYAEY